MVYLFIVHVCLNAIFFVESVEHLEVIGMHSLRIGMVRWIGVQFSVTTFELQCLDELTEISALCLSDA